MRKFYFSKKSKLFFLSLLFLSGFALISKAQVNIYGFSQSAGTYTPIVGGTMLGNTTTDDQRFVDPALPLGGTVLTGVGFPIGFNFSFNGNVFDRLAINANGWISLGKTALLPNCVNNASTSAYTPLSSVAAITPVELRSRIAGIGRDIQAQAGAEIRLETIGSAPNRVCVIQWTNYKKFGGGGTGDNLNFQIRLNETSNTVDVVYGTIVFNATTNTADVGLGGSAATDFNNRTTTTNWNTTTAGPLNTSRCTMLNTVTVPVPGTTFTWTPPVPCTGTPSPGNTLASANPACATVAFTLSLQNNPAVTGFTYQWQSSPDGTAWTDITGATGITYSASQTVTTWYRANVTCSGNTGTSTPVQVTMASPTSCYCIPPTTNCNLDDVILNVTVGGINNNSTCSTNGYVNYVGTVGAASVIAGVSYPMSVSVGPGGTEHVGVWIDYNQDGIFAATEFSVLGSGNGVIISGNITIPATASLGTTRMRVRVRFNVANTGADACTGYTFGETEDYSITISPCIPVAITTQPANATILCGANATFTVATTGSAPIFKWQEKTSASAFWTDLTNTGVYSGVTTNTLTISNVPVTMNGYKYRLLYSGPCRAIDSSNVVTLTVTPYIATVNPTSVNICNGSSQQLSITNTLGNLIVFTEGFGTVLPAGWAVKQNSLPLGPTGWAQGDATVFPANTGAANSYIEADYQNTDPVGVGTISNWLMTPVQNMKNGDLITFYSRIPAGTEYPDRLEVRISANGASVNVGTTETSVGDFTTLLLTINPTLVTGVYPKVWTQFTATVSGLAAPTTGRVAFRYFVTNAGGNAPNSNYIGIDDVNYISTGALATGVWTGPAGTMFTDAGLTTPYTGTAINTIYVNPTASTQYSVVVTTATPCVSNPTIIPVTVSIPVGTVTPPANTTICTNDNATFTVSAASGNAIAYQWQESTDGGANWTNIANAGIYSGATTGTLTLTGVPVTYNNYQYRAILSVAVCSSSITSAAAILTVNPTPVVTITAVPNTPLSPGMTTTLTANSTPAGATYQWYNDGVAIAGATSQTLVVDVDGLGTYTVTLVDVNGCAGTSATGLPITAARSDIMYIYPSPNTGQFQVRYQNTDGNTAVPRTLSIFDSKGARVFTRTYNINSPYGRMDVDLSNHARGVYRVELSDRSGNRIKSGSVLVL